MEDEAYERKLTEPYWLEDPSTPLGVIKDHLVRGTGDVLGKVREDLAGKREPFSF